jgi:hypothetical protein
MHGSEVLYCHSAGQPSKMERRSAASTLWMRMSISFAAKAIVRSMPAARARQPTPYNRQSEKVNLQVRLLSCRIK